MCALNASLMTRPSSRLLLSCALNACVLINVRILFITRFCRDIFCGNGGHVIRDLLHLCCGYDCLNMPLIGVRALVSLMYTHTSFSFLPCGFLSSLHTSLFLLPSRVTFSTQLRLIVCDSPSTLANTVTDPPRLNPIPIPSSLTPNP